MRASCCACWPAACARGRASIIPVRVPGSESNAPHFTSDSIAFLFTAWQSTRRQKSQIDLNGPSSSRAWMIASTAW